MTLSQLDGGVLLTVRDALCLVPVRTTPQVMDVSGRGLMLVETLSKEWGASADGSGSKSVWASFATRTNPESAPMLA